MDRARTPVMRQFESAKGENPDALLFFRMGDFYELFYEDAEEASRLLDITLTARGDGVPMAGVPVRAADGYLRKLVELGRRVAVCEQVEDARKAKGIVKRAVVRVLTPGTLTEDTTLDGTRNNFLAALVPHRPGSGAGRSALAWVDLSTGAFELAEFAPDALSDELARLEPAELLVAEDALATAPDAAAAVAECEGLPLQPLPAWRFDPGEAERTLREHYGVADLGGYGLDDLGPALGAAGALLSYLAETQKTALPHLRPPRLHRPGDRLLLDRVTLRCLEVVANQRDGGRNGTLLSVVDRSRTPMGARLLRTWLTAPLQDLAAISARQDAVAELTDAPVLRSEVRDALRAVRDLERLAARVATGRATPRDVAALGKSLEPLPRLRERLGAAESAALVAARGRADPLDDLRAEIQRTVVADAPMTIRDGAIVQPGYSAELDEIRSLGTDAKRYLAELQAREIERTGIATLRVGYTSVFGYYIEVTRAQSKNVPADYQRRQTLKNTERYITPELKEYEAKVLSADDRARALEEEIFLGLRAHVAAEVESVLETARAVAEIDALASFADVAADGGWVRPVVDDGHLMDVRQGRHPVLDAAAAAGAEPFVPNDVHLDGAGLRVALVTGPNMAGKSTYIRQVALLALLAHTGSFVPADSARIGRVDRVMARVGASDDISRGRSTFMVEMMETAHILHHATDRSLVILDEVGRGTSTYDGVALAWAITEHLADVVRCRTLFATHYHELTSLPDTAQSLAGAVRNYRVAVREWGDRVVFLRRIEEGGTDRSYGIHVARLAGLPEQVVGRARDVLEGLEEARSTAPPPPASQVADVAGPRQLALFAPPEDPLLDEIRALDVDSMTPLEALTRLHAWRARLRGEPPG